MNEARTGTFQALYLGDAASFLLPFAILLLLPHVGRRHRRRAGTLTRAPPPAAPIPAAGLIRGGYRQVLRDKAFLQFFIFALVLTTFGYAQVEIGFTAFSINVADVSARVVGFAFAANTLIIVVLQLFVLRWIEGRSRTRILSLVALMFSASWVVLAGAGWAGSAGFLVAAAVLVVACSAIFAFGETLLSPVMPAITNALATDELRGRYNAMASMVWGVGGIIGPVAAGPLIGKGHATAWLVLVIVGCLFAGVMALRLHRRLTPDQDGRVQTAPATPTRTDDPLAALAVS